MALLKRLTVTVPRVRMSSAAPASRQTDELDLAFNSPIDAFKSKKTSELVRALFVYQICSIEWLVNNQDMVSRSRTAGALRKNSTPATVQK